MYLEISPVRTLNKVEQVFKSLRFAKKNTYFMQFIDPDSKDNVDLINYISTWKSKNLKFYTATSGHTCRELNQGNKFSNYSVI